MLLIILVGGFASTALAQPTLQTILTNGPVSNRFNLVVFSEGYTSNQLTQFRADATNAVAGLLSHLPYQEYASYFNAFAIAVPSNQSGSDHPNSGLYRDTYFNSAYDAVSDYLITIPSDSQGQGKVDALLQALMPQANLSILLVNDPTPGGSDGFDQTAIAAVGVDSGDQAEILTHETGHVVGNLGDEYTYPYPGFPDTEEPNTTQETRPAFIKWRAWILTNTPLPTPPTSAYASVIGLFEGAHYHTTGWYRPKLDCLMNHLYAPFCEVCRETLVLAFYAHVRPVDSFHPLSTNLSLVSTQSSSFSLSVLAPSTHSLQVQWSADGVDIPGGTNSYLVLGPQSPGLHTLTAVVTDPTGYVRNDPSSRLRQVVTWSLNVSPAPLRLVSPLLLPGNAFAFCVTGSAPQGFAVQTSTNLTDWVSVGTNFLAGGQCWYTNPPAPAVSRAFFRTRAL